MLDLIRRKLEHRKPSAIHPLGDDTLREAAVLMALTAAPQPEVVFIKRAEHVSSHQGQVAFPGGMWEPEDTSLIHTALRESEEEIALPQGEVKILAAMEPRVTRFSVRVSPFVGLIPEGLSFVPELSEVDSVFLVPLDHLLEPGNYTRSRFQTPVGTYDAPCIFWQEYCIWGFTFGVMLDVLKEVFDFEPGSGREIRTREGGSE